MSRPPAPLGVVSVTTPMPCTIAAEYNTAAEAQITAAALSTPDTVNAHFSLLATNPFISETTRNLNARFVDAALAYFIVGVDNCPILVIPATSPSYKPASPPAPPPTMPPTTPPATPPVTTEPPAAGLTGPPPDAVIVPGGAPCPQGFVAQQPGTTSTATIEEMVGHQLLQIPVTQVTTTGPCSPLPTVTTVGEWVTLSDCLAVTILKTHPTTGLTLQTRVLGCDGQLYYSSYNLDNVPVGVQSTLTFPPAPGYLLDACVSLPIGTAPALTVFATLALQHSCQAGLPPQAALASGYVTSLYPLSWPSGTAGAPYTPPSQTPAAGTGQLIQVKGTSGAPVNSLALTLTQAVTAGSTLIAFAGYRPVGGTLTEGITDDQTNTWVQFLPTTFYSSGWYVANAKGGRTTVTYVPPSNGKVCLHVIELSGLDTASPIDVSAQAGGVTPITATTASTSFADVGLAAVFGWGAATSDYNTPTGWSKLYDNNAASDIRLITLWNAAASAPPATWSFTAVLQSFSLYSMVAAARLSGQ